MSNNNILSIEDRFKFKVEDKYLVRLHEHGLFRLITLSTEPKFSKVTKLIFFHTLLNNNIYQELFFDHYTQKSAGKHGPFLIDKLNDDPYKVRILTLRSFGESLYHSISDSCLEYGYKSI